MMKETTRRQDKESGREQGRPHRDLLDALEDVLQRVDKLPILDSREEEILGYGDDGIPH